ncbi:flavodoxin family protein [Devosia sp. CN2-171]|uniref:flavodoxin family protein n=1 Tax=Devosia sp. CN2-171 TaxID=3400909 RepID=UPI003BF9054B
MRIAIVYDSVFGNTAVIAEAIARSARELGEVTLLQARDAAGFDPAAFDLLVVGSPTRGFAPTPVISEFTGGLPKAALAAAAFDTRLDPDHIQPVPLRWVIQVGGYAADRIVGTLHEKGYRVLAPNGDFLVHGTEGPLKPGEIERAEVWLKQIAGGVSTG